MIDGARVVRERIDYDNRKKLVFVGSDGWPIEKVEGRFIRNFLRRILHTRKIERYENWLKRTGERISF